MMSSLKIARDIAVIGRWVGGRALFWGIGTTIGHSALSFVGGSRVSVPTPPAYVWSFLCHERKQCTNSNEKSSFGPQRQVSLGLRHVSIVESWQNRQDGIRTPFIDPGEICQTTVKLLGLYVLPLDLYTLYPVAVSPVCVKTATESNLTRECDSQPMVFSSTPNFSFIRIIAPAGEKPQLDKKN